MGELPAVSALAVEASDNTLLVIFFLAKSSSFSVGLRLNFKYYTQVTIFTTGMQESCII